MKISHASQIWKVENWSGAIPSLPLISWNWKSVTTYFILWAVVLNFSDIERQRGSKVLLQQYFILQQSCWELVEPLFCQLLQKRLIFHQRAIHKLLQQFLWIFEPFTNPLCNHFYNGKHHWFLSLPLKYGDVIYGRPRMWKLQIKSENKSTEAFCQILFFC